MVDAMQVMQFFANGIVFGSILAVAAIGLSLVYGILNLSNFAHGDLVTLGAFMTLFFGVATQPGGANLTTIALITAAVLLAVPLLDAWRTKRLTAGERQAMLLMGLALLVTAGWLGTAGPGGAGTTNRVLIVAALMAIVATSIIVVGVEFLIWRPLRRKRANVLTLVITSIGLALIVRNGLQMYFGGGSRFLQRTIGVSETYFGVRLSPAQQLTIVATIVIIMGVHFFLKYTRTGKAMRALSDNYDLARVSGIDVDRIVVYVWIIAGTLVTIGGILLTLVSNNAMNVNMGFFILIPLFASVILGGIGSPYGAMLGGLVVGVAMKTSALWLGSQYELVSAFIILFLVLLTRPQGILGVKQ